MNGTSDKKVTGPALRLLDGDIAVVRSSLRCIHRALFLANGAPVHTSMMVKRVIRHFNIALALKRSKDEQGSKATGCGKTSGSGTQVPEIFLSSKSELKLKPGNKKNHGRKKKNHGTKKKTMVQKLYQASKNRVVLPQNPGIPGFY